RALENDDNAASALARTPASTASATAITTIHRPEVIGSLRWRPLSFGSAWRPAAPNCLPLREQSRLQVEHLPVLFRLRVVVAQQMEDSVHGEQVDLLACAVTVLRRLAGRDLRTQRDVSQIPLVRGSALVAGFELVHRERQHVGGA